MSSKKTFFLLTIILIFFYSCRGYAVERQYYQHYILDTSLLQALPLKNKHWKSISSIEEVTEKTVLLVSSDWIIESLVLPPKVELHFCGGSIKGDIIFNNTYLSGFVKLHGSNISGTIKNELFQTGWICYGDGIHDDAHYINQILKVCNNVLFNKGVYLLSSYHNPNSDLKATFHKSVKSHIGIYKNNVALLGEDGASLLIKEPGTAISIYSKPNDIANSVENVLIEGLIFRNDNNGKEFFEFLHTIKLIGTKDLAVKNCKFFNFWGDAISLSHYGDTPETGERTRNSRIIIRDNYIDGGCHHNRNGVSIISAKHVLVENNVFMETSSYNMPGSIDIEANNSAYTIGDIVIKNNVIQGCQGGLGAIGIVSNEKEAPIKNIKIKRNTISDTQKGIAILIESHSSTENIQIIKNEFLNCKSPMIIRGNGFSRDWTIKRNNQINNIKVSGAIEVKHLKTDIKEL